MSASAILTAIYGVVANMTVANGYSAEWIKHEGDDNYFNSQDKNRFSVFVVAESNLDRETGGGGGSQGEYTNQMEVEFHLRIPLKASGINPSQVPFETMKDVLDGVEDVQRAFEVNSIDATGICAAGAFDWYYEGYETELMDREEKYSTIKVVMTYQFYYRVSLSRR